MFLLDTNIVSELVKRTPNPKVVGRFQATPPEQLWLSVISVFELRFGAACSAKPGTLWAKIQRDILSRVQVLPLQAEDAITAGDVRSPLVAAGQALSIQDVLLAGVAMNRNLTFVTRNRRDFDRVVGLKIENWFE